MADFSRPLTHQTVIPSDFTAGREVVEHILGTARQQGYSTECAFAIHLSLEEAIVNAIKHGNKNDTSKRVVISYSVEPERLTVRVRDEGTGFDPCCVPDCTAPERISVPNGRGIMLMHAYMDSVCYNDQGNEVQLVKERC